MKNRKQDILKDKEELIKAITQLGGVIDELEFNRMWKYHRNKLYEKWKNIAEENYTKMAEMAWEDPSEKNLLERAVAQSILVKLSSLQTIQSARELIRSSNAVIVAGVISIVSSIMAIVFTVLRVTGLL